MTVNFYVDGFNLYCGLCDARLHGKIWLNLQQLCELLLRKEDVLNRILYFTAVPNHNPRKKRDHETYLMALASMCPRIEFYYGDFTKLNKQLECPQCPPKTFIPIPSTVCPTCGWTKEPPSHAEKQTDVAIAVNLLRDAFQKDMEAAYVITGDTDLIPAFDMARAANKSLEIGVFFPPSRKHEAFKIPAVAFAKPIRHQEIKDCQFDNPVIDANGIRIPRPLGWDK